jgi:hypothetical protein
MVKLNALRTGESLEITAASPEGGVVLVGLLLQTGNKLIELFDLRIHAEHVVRGGCRPTLTDQNLPALLKWRDGWLGSACNKPNALSASPRADAGRSR